MLERITDATPEEQTRGHRFRYHLAAGFLAPGDVVLDAACGTGYGSTILHHRGGIVYHGVDKEVTEMGGFTRRYAFGAVTFSQVDLQVWQPNHAFDVFVGFETIEHLDDYSNYLNIAAQARSWVLLSAPVVPTVGINPYHRHDFTRAQLVDLFQDPLWGLFQVVDQPSEQSEIYVFRRRS